MNLRDDLEGPVKPAKALYTIVGKIPELTDTSHRTYFLLRRVNHYIDIFILVACGGDKSRYKWQAIGNTPTDSVGVYNLKTVFRHAFSERNCVIFYVEGEDYIERQDKMIEIIRDYKGIYDQCISAQNKEKQ